jgi:hypothetical protein
LATLAFAAQREQRLFSAVWKYCPIYLSA